MTGSRGEDCKRGGAIAAVLAALLIMLSVAEVAKAQEGCAACPSVIRRDCNGNRVDDCCDIDSGASDDLDEDGVPDECDNATCAGSDAVTLDCNGNNVDDFCDIADAFSVDVDLNGIPDECDAVDCETTLWGGFEPPIWNVGGTVHGKDYNQDGSSWVNASGSWTTGNQGCPSSQGKAIKGVSVDPPAADSLTSELFLTREPGILECIAHKYTLTFDLRAEAVLGPRTDWQILVKDGAGSKGASPSEDPTLVLIHVASTRSALASVTGAQGGTGKGRVLVQIPGTTNLINTGHVLAANQCFRITIELDNNAAPGEEVKVTVGSRPVVTVARGTGPNPLFRPAARMDYMRIEQVVNSAPAPAQLGRLALDNVTLCRQGAALDWLDCNFNCVDDDFDLGLGMSQNCNVGGVPDECDHSQNCACDGTPVTDSTCIWCNHVHAWEFEPAVPESFQLGALDGQRG